jgi:actin-related protein
MQKFICHGYSSALKSTTDTHPLLLVERAYNPPPIRQQIIECLFEDLNVPAAFLGKDAALACYGCGRVSGTVVDIGYSGTIVTPVYEGYVEQKGIRSSPIGVCQMDELILKQLDRINNNTPVLPLYQVRGAPTRKHDIHIAARLYLAQECRETGAGAAINTTTANFHAPHKSFTLPDGTMLDIPSKDRFAVSDLLFGNDKDSVSHREEYTERIKKELSSYIDNVTTDDDNNDNDMYSEAAAVGICKRRTTKRGDGVKQLKKPVFSNRILQQACQPYLLSHLDHLTSSPIASMICDAAYRCDRDQQVALLGNVVVGGGGACLGPTEQALPDLIREQVESIIHTHTPGWRVKVLAPGFQERSVLSWLGGSILASMGTFHDMWITKAEYEEWGSAIVNRKCP